MIQKQKIALVVGAGAIKNSWEPILRTLKHFVGFKIDADGANCYFAKLIYLLRFYATGSHPESKKQLQSLLRYVNEIKIAISEALIHAQNTGEIAIQAEFYAILDKFILLENTETALITTNWDLILEDTIDKCMIPDTSMEGNGIDTLHLHGSVTSPNGLYLPSETVKELYRTDEEKKEIGGLHGEAYDTIAQCNKAILYGVSLDPLDAELGQILSSGMASRNLQEIMIVNPDTEKIMQRAKLLLDDRFPVTITSYWSSMPPLA